jgi:two-component system sensor histidine kinase KdpD
VLLRIFDRFYRAPDAVTGGTGLGLSLVKGFIEAQGGRVTAENGANGGMIFTIHLPLRQTSTQPARVYSLQPNP